MFLTTLCNIMRNALGQLAEILGTREPEGSGDSVLTCTGDSASFELEPYDRINRSAQWFMLLGAGLIAFSLRAPMVIEKLDAAIDNLRPKPEAAEVEVTRQELLTQQLLKDLADEKTPKPWWQGLRVYFETEHGVSYAQDPLYWVGPDAKRYFVGFNDSKCCKDIQLVEFDGAILTTEDGLPPGLNSLRTGFTRYSEINNTLTAAEGLRHIGDVRSFANGTIDEAVANGGALSRLKVFVIEEPQPGAGSLTEIATE